MKILLISNMYPSKKHPFFGTFVKNFKEQLEKKEFTFELSVIQGKGISKFDKIKKYLAFFINTISKIKNENHDIIYIHYISHSLLPLLFIKSFSKKPLILNAHGSDVFVRNKVGLFIQKLVTPIIKKADMIVVPSDYFSDVIHEKFGISKNKIFTSPSGGVNTKLFTPLNIKKDIFTIGYVSRIDQNKGWDTLLSAVEILNEKELNFKVIIIGGGSQETLLIETIKKKNLTNIVSFLGPKSHQELPNYFNKMDIFTFPTNLNESLGLVGLEAMSCGIPVIGSNIGGLPSYIKNGTNGKLFEPMNVSDLVLKLEFFMNITNQDLEKYKKEALLASRLYQDELVGNNLSIKIKELYESCHNQ